MKQLIVHQVLPAHHFAVHLNLSLCPWKLPLYLPSGEFSNLTACSGHFGCGVRNAFNNPDSLYSMVADLSKPIIPYSDHHLAFPLRIHLTEISLFPIEEVQAAQHELAKGTNLVDYAVSLFGKLHLDKEVPAGEGVHFLLCQIAAN